MKVFATGDNILVEWTKQSNASTLTSQKTQMRATGPYVILEKIDGKTSYRYRRLPLTQTGSRTPPCQIRKVKTDRISLLPSKLMIHKITDGLDSIFVSFGKPAITNPLAFSLGASGFGTFE